MFLSAITLWGGWAWVMVSDTRAAPSSCREAARILPTCLWASQARLTASATAELHQLLSLCVLLVTALCARRRRHYVADRQSIVGVLEERNPDSTVMAAVQTEPQCSLAKNKSLLCHALRKRVGCCVTLSVTTGHWTPLPSWNLCFSAEQTHVDYSRTAGEQAEN